MVSDKIVPGLEGHRETIVCEHNVAGHIGKFSTPSLILLMEQASTEAFHRLLNPGQTSVGFEVNIRHLAPSSIGARVSAHAELTEVQGNKLWFSVVAHDGDTKIGEGTHRRAIIDTPPDGA